MNGFAIDASVLIKWVIAEPGADEAGARLLAPEIILAVAANVLWKASRGMML